MGSTPAADHGVGGAERPGGAPTGAPPAAPLRLIQAAVAGAGLDELVRLTAEACGAAIGASLSGAGPTVGWPVSRSDAVADGSLADYAVALASGAVAVPPAGVSDAVAIRVGGEIVGVVAALSRGPAEIALRPWLDAAAVALAVAAVRSDASAAAPAAARRQLLAELEHRPPADEPGLLDAARRVGLDLSAGAIALCALGPVPASAAGIEGDVVLTELDEGRWLGLVALTRPDAEPAAAALAQALTGAGVAVGLSMPHPEPSGVHAALVEASVLAELAEMIGPERLEGASGETFRLLVGVLLAAPEALRRLRALTVAELERYDSVHDTELLKTLQEFLAHHGSTTETAEVMGLHRHTVGYRLARVQEVAGLSPYESEGRERLSLGVKADRILAADRARLTRGQRRVS